MPLTSNVIERVHFGRTAQRACTSCTRNAAVALLVAGTLIMNSAVIVFGYVATETWHNGWAARVISLLLFLTVPFVVSSAFADFRSKRNLDTLTKRLACLGVSLAILGVLELALCVAEIYALIAFTS